LSWIRIRIGNTDPDPGEPFQYESTWIRIRNTAFTKQNFKGKLHCNGTISRAKAYLMNKNYREAQADARQCLKLGGTTHSCYSMLLESCVGLGEVAEGRAIFKLLSAIPNNQKAADMVKTLDQAEQHFNQSLQHADDKNYKEAENSINRYGTFDLTVSNARCLDQSCRILCVHNLLAIFLLDERKYFENIQYLERKGESCSDLEP